MEGGRLFWKDGNDVSGDDVSSSVDVSSGDDVSSSGDDVIVVSGAGDEVW